MRSNMQRITGAVLVLLVSHAALAADPDGINPADWPQYHRTSNAWRYSPLDQINSGNVKRLKVAWIHQPGDITNGLQATPIVIDGVAYYTSPYNTVYALNAATGEQIWRYDPDIDPIIYQMILTGQSRGVTVGRGKVFVGTSDGKFIALDQKTGKEVWVKQIVQPKKCQCGFTSPPQLAGEILYGGTMGGDFATSTAIHAVHADTGAPAWTLDTIRHDPQSWPKEASKHGGGAAWLPGTYDERTDTIYIGTGNAAPDFDGLVRPGDNKYTATLLALEPETGKIRWYNQEIPHEIWDYDSTFELLRVQRNGQEYLVHPSKSGFVFVYNQQGGRPDHVWTMARNITVADGYDLEKGDFRGRVYNHKRGQEILLCPSPDGIRNWNHGAYNPDTGLWYNNTMEMCLRFRVAQMDPASLGLTQAYFGTDLLEFVPPPSGASAHLDARDPITGKPGWSVDYHGAPGLGSLLTTGGNLVFDIDTLGVMRAHDARTGKELWHFRLGSGSRGGIVSYAVNGRQYILAASGISGWAYGTVTTVFQRIKPTPGGGILVAFTLEDP